MSASGQYRLVTLLLPLVANEPLAGIRVLIIEIKAEISNAQHIDCQKGHYLAAPSYTER